MAARKYVSYFRVSTLRQGRSGLGLEAQREAVQAHLNGGEWTQVGEYTEIESGKRNDRAELTKALAACRLHKATLVLAKLDRLARNVHFISSLMEAGVDFIAVDFPQANRLTVHILAAVAEHEAVAISQRTKAALRACRARGTTLGGYRGGYVSDEARRRSAMTRTAAADAFASDAMSAIEEVRRSGQTTHRGIARELKARGIPTRRGGEWTAVQVKAILARVL
jgi:DNA invertase Pin-like site-specific DNA recombinase